MQALGCDIPRFMLRPTCPTSDIVCCFNKCFLLALDYWSAWLLWSTDTRLNKTGITVIVIADAHASTSCTAAAAAAAVAAVPCSSYVIMIATVMR